MVVQTSTGWLLFNKNCFFFLMLLYKLFIGAGPIVQFWIPTFRILAKSLNTMQHWKAVFGSSTAEQVKDLCWATRHSSHIEKVWAICEIIETSHILLKRVCSQWDKIFIAGERSYGSRVGSFFFHVFVWPPRHLTMTLSTSHWYKMYPSLQAIKS